MLEAIVLDIVRIHGIPNAVAGCLIFWLLPMNEQIHNNDSPLRWPLNYTWIFLYSIWNSWFSYANGYGTTTRLCLITSLVVTLFVFNDPDTWLFTRTLSISLNQILRILKPHRIFRKQTLDKTSLKFDFSECVTLLTIVLNIMYNYMIKPL